jgi:hypothetical protein
MKTILSIGIILLSLSSLAGCFSVPITPDTPNEYAENKNTIELHYGLTREEIIRELGEPEWIKNRNEATFFIYEWRDTDKEIVFMLAFIPYPVPVPVAGGRNNINWYCLLLEFSKDDHLVHHEASETSYGNPAPWGSIGDTPEKQINCLEYFKRNHAIEERLGYVLEKTLVDAADSVSTFEYLIAVPGYELLRILSKYSYFKINDCVVVLISKFDVELSHAIWRNTSACDEVKQIINRNSLEIGE